jgi:two-component system, cell cycle sensor histidine kinase and response regulator CckA
MAESSLRNDSMLFQWNFFERTISNYSIIIKMFQHMEHEKDLFLSMPRAFVEETVFDSCQLGMRDAEHSSFFSIDDGLRVVECNELEKTKGVIHSPSVLHSVFGYGTLYLYPLKRGIHVFGYLMLGKRKQMPLEAGLLRDLELLCEVLNRFMLLNLYLQELKSGEEEKARQLDSRLAVTKTLLENIIDQMPHAMFMIDRNGSICFANRSAREEFFDGKTALTGEKMEGIVQGIERGFLDKDLVVHGEIHHRKGDDYKLYSLESYPVKDSSGRVVFKTVILKDVADERMEEEENDHRNRMETIGKLAGGIAHDFNNVLTGILGYASLMKRMIQDEGQLKKYAEVIESSAKRAATLTEHLLNFSRRQRTKTTDQMDLNALLKDVLFLIRESFRTITIETEFDETLPPIRGDAGELQHVILNLCINAKDAMPEGGTLRVKTEKKAYLGGREFAAVTIEDTGCGIDDRVRNKVFEPYFTTKSEGKKLGMGLYIVQKVVRSHGGFIEMGSAAAKGTCFTLYFPLSVTEKEVLLETDIPATDTKKNILIVDDEEVVRGLLTGVLVSQGFTVLVACDGTEALSLFESRASSIDLVILDMIMPGMKGEEVLRRLREVSRDVKVVISSGYMTEEQRRKLQEYGVDAFLDKPYSDMEAINKVRYALSQRTSKPNRRGSATT